MRPIQRGGNGSDTYTGGADIIASLQAVGSANYRYTLSPGLTGETTNNRSLRTEDFVLEQGREHVPVRPGRNRRHCCRGCLCVCHRNAWAARQGPPDEEAQPVNRRRYLRAGAVLISGIT